MGLGLAKTRRHPKCRADLARSRALMGPGSQVVTQLLAGIADKGGMQAIGYHLISKLANGAVIAPTLAERRIVASIVLEQGRRGRVLCFNLPDTHLHLENLAQERESVELMRRIEISISKRLRLGVRFQPVHPEPIRSQSHLFNCFDYILKQQARHGLNWDPFHDASNLPDLLGLRTLGAHTVENVKRYLPRVDRRLLLSYLGIQELRPANGPLPLLREATLAASGLVNFERTGVRGRIARTAAVYVAGHGVSLQELASTLEVGQRTVSRLRREPLDESLVRAIQLQLALRSGALPRLDRGSELG